MIKNLYSEDTSDNPAPSEPRAFALLRRNVAKHLDVTADIKLEHKLALLLHPYYRKLRKFSRAERSEVHMVKVLTFYFSMRFSNICTLFRKDDKFYSLTFFFFRFMLQRGQLWVLNPRTTTSQSNHLSRKVGLTRALMIGAAMARQTRTRTLPRPRWPVCWRMSWTGTSERRRRPPQKTYCSGGKQRFEISL